MKKTLSAMLFAMLLVLSAWSVSADVGPTAHDPVVTLDPTVANCEADIDDFEFTVEVSNSLDNGFGIYNVKIYRGTAGIYDITCGAPPSPEWSVEYKYDLYCEYETDPEGAAVIEYGEAPVEFAFDIDYDEEAAGESCDTDFRITTLDNEGIMTNGVPGEEEVTTETLFVDCTDPYIMKTLEGTHLPLTSCELESQNSVDGTCDWWITQDTELNFNAFDDAENTDAPGYNMCNQGIDYCEWRFYLDGTVYDDAHPMYDVDYCDMIGGVEMEDGWCRLQNGASLEWAIEFSEDSEHEIEVRCVDGANNWASLEELDKVDDTPPTTEKWLNEPKKEVETEGGTVEYIDTRSTISMSVADGGDICAIGVDKTWYHIDLVTNLGDVGVDESDEDACYFPNRYCNDEFLRLPPEPSIESMMLAQEYCELERGYTPNTDDWYTCVEEEVHEDGFDEGWKLWRGDDIGGIDESCHAMRYFSVDHLGNREETQFNCFFVDKTAPTLTKVNNDVIDDKEEPHGLFHWATSESDIEFTCVDEGPHPSGDERFCFAVGFDNATGDGGYGDITTQYCDKYGGTVGDDGFCCIDASGEDIDLTFNFDEESLHDIQYYCYDAVEKGIDDVHQQWYRVDNTAPKIEKTMVSGPFIGDCLPPNGDSNADCYVNEESVIGVSVHDPDPTGMSCAVDDISCVYRVLWEVSYLSECQDAGGEMVGPGLCRVEENDDVTESWEVSFNEDSTHQLYVYCEDALGNPVEDREWFRVDLTPPETTKLYSEPVVPGGGEEDYDDYFVPYGQSFCEQECGGICLQEAGCPDTQECMEECLHDGEWGYARWITTSTNVTLDPSDEKVEGETTYWRNLYIPDNETGEYVCGHLPRNIDGDINPDNMIREGDWCEPDIYLDAAGVDDSWDVQFDYNEDPALGPDWVTADDGRVDIDTVGGEMVKAMFNGNRVYEFSVPMSEMNAEAGDFVKLFAYLLDGADPTNDRTLNVHPDGAGWGWTGDWRMVELREGSAAITVDGDLSDWEAADFVLSDDTANEKHNGNAAVTSEFSLYLRVYDGILYVGIDFTGDTNDDVGEYGGVSIDGAKVAFENDAPWKRYTGPFQKKEESCHIIEYFSEDALGNTEDMKWQCVFVDDKPPEHVKKVGMPSIPIDGCDPTMESCDFYVSQETPIHIMCEDPQPHPVDHERTCFKVSYEGDDLDTPMTEQECLAEGGEMRDGMCYLTRSYCGDLVDEAEVGADQFGFPEYDELSGYCCVDPFVVKTVEAERSEPGMIRPIPQMPGLLFFFEEDSWHNLEFYCEDALGNEGPLDIEYFAVDTVPPETEKIYTDPVYDAWVTDEYELCYNEYIDTCESQCVSVGEVTTGDPCIDECLMESGCYPARFIDNATRVVLNGTDPQPHPAGLLESYYRWTRVPDKHCLVGGSVEFEDYERFDGSNYNVWYVNGATSSQADEYESSTDNPGDWDYNYGPDTPPSGVGSLRMMIDNAGVAWRSFAHAGTKLSDLSTLQYSTYSSWGNSYPTLQLEWDQDCVLDSYEGNLIFIPSANTDMEGDAATPGEWQTWNALDGVWTWSSDFSEQWTWSELLTEFPDACIRPDFGRVGLKLGTESTNEVAFVDALVVNDWQYDMENEGTFLVYEEPFGIPEESCHMIDYYSVDALGNTEMPRSQFVFVDHQEPRADTWFEACTYEGEDALYIGSLTDIGIEAWDVDPHPSGVQSVEYRVTLVENEVCRDRELCGATTGDGEWTAYEETVFNITDQSCHLIEVNVTDNVEKDEVYKDCVFVDTTAPEPNKTVDEPSEPMSEQHQLQGEVYYPGLNELCDEEGKCWDVTLLTPINLECVDDPAANDDHPSGVQQACFTVGLDGEDVTDEYCKDKLGKNWEDSYNQSGDGYCCIDAGATFLFNEESWHELSYYCVDNTCNAGEVDTEYFKVEGTPFEIHLFKKWNLISVPFVLIDNDPEVVFGDLENVESVWTYDSVAGEWLVWRPEGALDLPPMGNELEHVKPGWGYWVMMEEDETLTIGGSLFRPAELPPSKPLAPGWNLIGTYGTQWQHYPEQEDVSFMCGDEYTEKEDVFGSEVYCSLNSLVDTQQGFPRWSSLWSYVNCGDHEAGWTGLNACPFDDGSLDVLEHYETSADRMYAGRGYWVEMDVEDEYAPATNCVWNLWNLCVGSEGYLPR